MPNKKLTIIIVAGVVVLLVCGFFFSKKPVVTVDENIKYLNVTSGISFSYPPDYVLSERDVDSDHHSITLINKSDLPLPVNSEGPTAITIDIYKNNVAKNGVEDWIRNSKESNYKLGGETISETVVGGLPASSFRWSGLYEGTTIVVAELDRLYAFTVTYLEMGAPIIQDFVTIRDSVEIAQPPITERIKLYYYNGANDQGPGGAQCSKKGLVAIEQLIPETTTLLTDAIKLLLTREISQEEKSQGITSEFPLAGVVLVSASIKDGVATLTFSDPQNKTSGGACRTSILKAQIEATAKQFPEVKSVRFIPEGIFQP